MFKLKAKSYNLKATQGFTLIELLIVIAIIAILAGVVFVSLDPLKRFQDARNAARWTDVTAILSAIKVDQVDNGGGYISSINSMPLFATNYIIGTATGAINCVNTNCPAATSTDRCVNLSGLSDEGYLAKIPVSPKGVGTWSDSLTGYYLSKKGNGSITIGACDAENNETIAVER